MFPHLRFWNSSLRADCPVLDDSQGITLYSLGGVFISTGVGLAIAMVVLVAEVMYYSKQEKRKPSGSKISKIITVGNSAKINPNNLMTNNFTSNY